MSGYWQAVLAEQEIERLRKLCDDLQARNTQLVEENRRLHNELKVLASKKLQPTWDGY